MILGVSVAPLAGASPAQCVNVDSAPPDGQTGVTPSLDSEVGFVVTEYVDGGRSYAVMIDPAQCVPNVFSTLVGSTTQSVGQQVPDPTQGPPVLP
ncbi:MAG: hypothetical protein QOE90_2765 [Thermoplasmata archaeon]|jgi:hypothetical protein|nr:hypothetical protein [Thermoplasmata archaeon]